MRQLTVTRHSGSERLCSWCRSMIGEGDRLYDGQFCLTTCAEEAYDEPCAVGGGEGL